MKLHYIIYSIILVWFLQSCTERVEIDLEQAGENKLVVFAEITNDFKRHKVFLSSTSPYFSNEKTPGVKGATITLDDGQKVVTLAEDPELAGCYLTPSGYHGVVGRTYKLNISQVDVNEDGQMEEYTAQTVMKHAAPVEGMGIHYNSKWDGWEVALFSHDKAETKDYYLFKIYKNGVLETDSISDYWTSDDKFFNGNTIDGPMVQYFDEDEGEFLEKGDMVTLELAGITKEYYDFIDGIQAELSDNIPLFSGPAANVKGNISNGALGFFSVMEVNRGSIVYDGN